MNLPSALAELEHLVKSVAAGSTVTEEAIEQKFAVARSFFLEAVSLFREVEETLYGDDTTLQKLELCGREMAHLQETLNKLQDAVQSGKQMVLNERLRNLLASHKRCLEFTAEFSHLASRQPIYSPNPVFDSFIKAGVKVHEGQLPSERLADRFAGLLPEVQKVERLVGLFPKLHSPPQELVTSLEQGLQGLRTAYGALSSYLDRADELALTDGLKLLGSSSVILADKLNEAEQFALERSQFSAFRPMEEWLRLKQYIAENPRDPIPEPWIVSTVAHVFFVWDFLLDQAGRLKLQPLLKDAEPEQQLSDEVLQSAWKARVEGDALLAELNGPSLLTSSNEPWIRLCKPIEELQRAVEISHRALEHLLDPFRELPALETIAILKEQVKRGEVSPEILAEAFREQLVKVDELIQSVDNGCDPFSVEFRDLLPLHRSAFMGMLENLEEGDWGGLDARWQGVLTTLPHLAHLSRTLRQRLAAQSSGSKQVSCLRCEAKNEPFRRVCSSCGANLPTIVQQMQTYSEIDLNEGREGGSSIPTLSPSAIDLLESMVRGLEQNRTTKKDAADALRLLIDDVDRQRKMFTQKLLPMMGKDEVLDAYLRVFAQGMGQYFANLMQMLDAVQDGALARIHSALAETRDTLEALDAMKERVDGALRG